MKELTALAVRCPNISDGARVTLLELALHEGTGRMPSLNELKRIRQTSRSTVQSHVDELVEREILLKSYGSTPSNVVITLNRTKLFELNGLDDGTQIKPWINEYVVGGTTDKSTIKTVFKHVAQWNVRDAANYFNLLGARKGQKSCTDKKTPTANKRVYGMFNKLLSKYGAKVLKQMIDYFAANFNRMSCSYDINTLVLKQAKLVEAVYK